jgi:hypothetical protein
MLNDVRRRDVVHAQAGGVTYKDHTPAYVQGGLKAPELEDPREAILRHAGKTDGVFSRLTAAYQATQPVPIFAPDEEDEGEEEEEDGA